MKACLCLRNVSCTASFCLHILDYMTYVWHCPYSKRFQPVSAFVVILQSDGKIARNPAATDLRSSSLIRTGAFHIFNHTSLHFWSERTPRRCRSSDIAVRSSRRFVVLKWISSATKSLQWVERERREETVVRHELTQHTCPNVASVKQGNATAISATSSSVKRKAHPLTRKHNELSVSLTNPWNRVIGDVRAASIGTPTQDSRTMSF